ncbi:MAG: hypothetical protein M3Z08_13105 [Chloroflexota bacterium]|nr:hypothetical protein [Chloroflexota bacterium]
MGKKRHTYVLELQAPSLYAWWEQWLEEKPAIEPEQANSFFVDDGGTFLDELDELDEAEKGDSGM